MTTEPISRAITQTGVIGAYLHCAAEADRRAEAQEALGETAAARSLRSLAESMKACAGALGPRDPLAAAMEKLNDD